MTGYLDRGDSFTQGVLNQLGAIADTQFSHEVGLVSFDRLATDHQYIGNFLGSMSLGGQFEDFPLPVSQLLIRVVPDSLAAALVVINQEFGYRR